MGQRRRRSPGRSRRIHVDDRRAAVRVVGIRAVEVGVGPGARLHDLVRPVHDGAVPVERARADRRPGPCGRIDDARHPVWACIEDAAIREDEQERVERRREPGARQVGPRVRPRVVDRGQRIDGRIRQRVIEARPVDDDVVAGHREHAAVSELSGGRIPASDRHVGAAEVGLRRRIEDRRVGEALVCVDVATDEQRAAVSELNVPRAEEIPPIGNRFECAGSRVPEPLRVQRVAEAVEREHLSVRLERHVHCDDRPRARSAPLTVFLRRLDGGDRPTELDERDDHRAGRHCSPTPRRKPSPEPLGVGHLSSHERAADRCRLLRQLSPAASSRATPRSSGST